MASDVETSSYPVDFIMHVQLEAALGSDIPLHDMTFDMSGSKKSSKLTRKWGNELDSENEDYWLFSVHCHDSKVTIAIGGETFVLTTSEPSLRNFSNEETCDLFLEHDFGYDNRMLVNLQYNRYVAVRCPKMSNPAITVKAEGYYGTLNWVGLFVKSAPSGEKDSKNEFIAVRTINTLLHEYAESMKDSKYFSWDGGIDITGRTVTLFPKQLSGTQGSNRELYKQFVTQKPKNTIGERHFDIRFDVGPLKKVECTKYVWNQYQRTVYDIHHVPTTAGGGGIVAAGWSIFKMDYASGIEIINDRGEGWATLLSVFGSVAKFVTSIIVGNVGGALAAFFEVPLNVAQAQKDADIKGFVKAVVELVDKSGEELFKKKKPNTESVSEILAKSHPKTADFGQN